MMRTTRRASTPTAGWGASARSDAVVLGTACGLGLGIFRLPLVLVVLQPFPTGRLLPLAFLAAAVPALAVAVVSGQLAAHTPGPGGDYEYLQPTLGRRAAFVLTAADAVALLFAMAGASLTCARLVAGLVYPTATDPMLVVSWAVAAAVAALAVGLARAEGPIGRGTLVATAVLGILIVHRGWSLPAATPPLPTSGPGVAIGAAVLSFAFAGLTLGQHVFEADARGSRDVRLGVILPTVVALGYYLLVSGALVHGLTTAALASLPSDATVRDALWPADATAGRWATVLLALALWDNVWAMAFRVTRLAAAWLRDVTGRAARPSASLVLMVYAAVIAVIAGTSTPAVGAASAATFCINSIGVGIAGWRSAAACTALERATLRVGGALAAAGSAVSLALFAVASPAGAAGGLLALGAAWLVSRGMPVDRPALDTARSPSSVAGGSSW